MWKVEELLNRSSRHGLQDRAQDDHALLHKVSSGRHVRSFIMFALREHNLAANNLLVKRLLKTRGRAFILEFLPASFHQIQMSE